LEIDIIPSTYDAANRLVSVNAVNYTWDNNGNLLSDGEYTYTYDHANRLKTVTDGVNTRSYSYNGLGDRVSETVNEVTTDYVLDLAGGLTQVLAEGTNSYLNGNARIMQENSSEEKEYFLGDALGSVRMLTDEEGEITLLRSYEPYGEVLSSQGTGDTSYAFTGEQYDPQTGLVYLRARYYSTASGRFMSRDTWTGDEGMPMSYNVWLYGYGNPVRYTDPSGWIAINEDKTAKNLVNYLYVNYSVNITIDWGYVFNIMPHPAPGDHGPASCWNEGLWSSGDLNIIRYSVETFARSFPTIDKFKKAVGPSYMLKKYYACGRGCTSGNKITFLSRGKPAPTTGISNIVMNTGFDIDAWTVVHEMGHVWDYHLLNRLSTDLEKQTGGYTDPENNLPDDCDPHEPGCNRAGYFYGDIPSKGADSGFNRLEDFAESVAAYVFPGYAQNSVM